MPIPFLRPFRSDPTASEARAAHLLQHAAEQSEELLAVVDVDFRLLAFNHAYHQTCRRLFDVDLALGDDLRAALAAYPEERAAAEAVWGRSLAGEEHTARFPFREDDPDARVWEATFRPLRDEDGRVVAALQTGRDVTEREARIAAQTAEADDRRAAAELERTRLRAVLDVLPVAVWVADAEGRLVETNDAGRKIWGEGTRLSERPEDYGVDFKAWWPDGRRLRSEDWAMARALTRGEVSLGEEIRIETADGVAKTILNYASPIRDEAGAIAGGVAVNVDITGRKREEERQGLLAALGPLLSSLMDTDARVRRLGRLLAERMADFVVVDLVEGDGAVRRVDVAAADPGDAGAADRLREQPVPVEEDGWGAVLTEGAPVLWTDVSKRAATGLFAVLEELGVVSLLAVPLRADGRILGALTLLSTRPDRRYGEAELRTLEEVADRIALSLENARLYEQATRAVREREEMVAVVSHDLRNPLHAITIAASMLDQPSVPESTRASQRGVLHRAAAQMERLISDLMDVTRMGAGSFTVHPAAEAPADLVREAVEMARGTATERGIELLEEVAAELPRVAADRTRIGEVFANLIANALDFTPEGGRVAVAAAPGEAWVRFRVSDTGPGIPPAERESIFDRFWQGRPGAHSGAGLGLSIARGIVEAHGGSIRLVDRPGPGAVFEFDLPLDEDG